MSQQQKYNEYLYFTIHQDTEQDAQDLVKKYQFDRQYGCLSFWNKKQINDEQTHLFNVMCLKFEIGEVEYLHDISQQIKFWLHHLKHQTQISNCPLDFIRTLHLVTHGANDQNAGFHLNHHLLKIFSELSIGFNLHGFLDADDGQDYPFTTRLASPLHSKTLSEYAYFWLESEHYTALELQQLLPELDFIVDCDQGISQRKQRKIPNSTRSSLSLKSKLTPTSFQLEEHLQDVISQIHSYQSELQILFFDENISFGINATGHLASPHHRQISAATIKQLFLLGINLDVDYYFS